MTCTPCSRGFHGECLKGKCKTCHPKEKEPVKEVVKVVEVKAKSKSKPSRKPSREPNPKIPRKHGNTAAGLKDPKSTGRKRAAKVYPIDKSDPCEWRGKKNCGGGKRPIVGCVDGYQRHRHHGPVKDTTRNYEGNVHRICARCHNHWHELNDLEYDASIYALLPHDPETATAEELVNDEMMWRTGAMGKKYVLASSKNMLKVNSEHED